MSIFKKKYPVRVDGALKRSSRRKQPTICVVNCRLFSQAEEKEAAVVYYTITRM